MTDLNDLSKQLDQLIGPEHAGDEDHGTYVIDTASNVPKERTATAEMTVEFFLYGTKRTKTFTASTTTTSSIAVVAQKLPSAVRMDADGWLRMQAARPVPGGPAPHHPRNPQTFQELLRYLLAPFRSPAPTRPDQRRPKYRSAASYESGVQEVTVSAAISIGADRQTFTSTATTSGSPVNAALSLIGALREDMWQWAYNWETGKKVYVP